VIVGRADERAAIDALLAAAERGESGALLVAGPPGIGKSTLIGYATETASRFRVLRAAAVESEMAFGYAAVQQLLLPVVDDVGRLDESQRTQLDAALGRGPLASIEPFRVGLAVLSLLADLASTVPVLVVIDDVQWLDEESATALAFVARRMRAERVAMIATLRDATEDASRFEPLAGLRLTGLTAPEALDLLSRSASTPVNEEVADRIVAATQGNPLALVELPRALTVEQLRGEAPLPDPLPIGDRLSAVFARRIRSLDDEARTLLLLAATERLGDPLLLRHAAAAAGVESWDRAVAAVEGSGLATFGVTVTMRHPLVRSAVYYGAAPGDRRATHAALAEALDDPADVDRRAWHLGAAAIGPDEQVARALEASAERARQRGGASAAAQYLWRAAELTPDAAHGAARLLEAARAELVVGRSASARELVRRAQAAGLDRGLAAGAAWTEALIHLVLGNVGEAGPLLAEALPAIRATETELAVGACFAANAVALSGGHLVEPSTRASIAEGTRSVGDRCRLDAPLLPLLLAIAARSDRESGSAAVAVQAVLDAARDQPRLQAAAGRSVHVVYFSGVLAAAEILDDRAWAELASAWSQLARETGALAALPVALGVLSWLEVLQGRLGSAASHIAEIEDLVSLTRHRGLVGAPAPAQVLREAWLGNETETRAAARELMQDAHERGQGIGVDHAHAALLVLDLGAGRYDAALREARHVFDRGNIGTGAIVLADVVEAAVRCDDKDTAERALARLSRCAAASGSAWSNGLVARGRALLSVGDEADAQFRVSIDELSRSTVANDLARTQLLYGEWLRRARRRKEARAPLHDALERFEAIGATAFAARARTELAATGEQVRARSAPVDVLTPQEAQIARLAASGQRNQQIAEQLYITTSTVEYHLRKVFVKVGVSSRTQLAQLVLPV
jgi:DNA-binding CsgD family transcriptional regulator